MTEKPAAPPITDPHHTQVTFVNQVVGQGHLNGVVNLTFAVANFTPNADGKVDIDLVVASRLRMDMFCATQLRDALTTVIDQALAKNNGTTH